MLVPGIGEVGERSEPGGVARPKPRDSSLLNRFGLRPHRLLLRWRRSWRQR